jgi:cell pole-organizing protein PopZ
MDEILASIRRIITEEDPPAPAAKVKAPSEPAVLEIGPQAAPMEAAGPAPGPPPMTDHALTAGVAEAAKVEAPPTPAAPEPPASPATQAEAQPIAAPADPAPQTIAPAAPAIEAEPAPLTEPATALAAASAFDRLAAAAETIGPRPNGARSGADRTLEDLAREMMAPLLKAWLDENLETIVREQVDLEIERIARSRARRS